MRVFARPLLLVLCSGVCLLATELEIPLEVREPCGVARRAGAVTSGIPLPRGLLGAGRRLRLFQGDVELPLQVTPLVTEPDGTLRWVLLDFLVDVGEGETRALLVVTKDREAKLPANALEIAEDGTAVSVSTGPLLVRVSKVDPFQLFERVEVRGQQVASGGVVDVVDATTKRRYRAGPPTEIAFEYRGPIRATLRVRGAYEPAAVETNTGVPGGAREAAEPFLRYTTRITTWAGKTAVRVEHVLANSDPSQVRYVKIERASLGVRHALGTGAHASAGAGDTRVRLGDGDDLWLHQGRLRRASSRSGEAPCRAGSGDRVIWKGADAGGWIAVEGRDRCVFLCDRDFTGDPPRRLVADGSSIAVDYVSDRFAGEEGAPFASDHLWLYDLSHRTADLWLDFDLQDSPDTRARAFRGRLLAFAPPEWYARANAFGVGRFGTLEDEKRVYRTWGWRFDEKKVPRSLHQPGAFVRWEDNHYESEADSAEALLLMALRTGERGFFDLGEAWARYHANLHAWRTDGWTFDDGAIWFPQGGPLGTRRARKPPSRTYEHWGKGTGDDRELWHLAQGKSCYCHFYGAGLVDHYLLTGSRDSLEAALDLAEQKNSESRKHRGLEPGKTKITDTRGFGRGFYVVTRLVEVLPESAFLRDLARLYRDVLWRLPDMDERGFAPCHIGTGFGGFDLKRDVPPQMRAFMDREGITIDEKGWLEDRSGSRWPVVCLGGTWQHAYVQAGAYRYWQVFGDEDMRDFAYGFGRFAARYLMSDQCKQTHYYAYMDVPLKGEPWDPWRFQPEHTATRDGEGCVHSGWYTRFFPDAIAMAYTLSGDERLLHRAREFWHYGSKRRYRSKKLAAGSEEVLEFATHRPPKDDSVLSTSRLFHEWAHPRTDREGPETVGDLEVSLQGGGRATVRFTAPRDRGGGKVAEYQVKCAELPIVSYDDFDFARDDGTKRNFWRAENVAGEPIPSEPGAGEEFVVTGVPAASALFFVVASRDDSGNSSDISESVRAAPPRGYTLEVIDLSGETERQVVVDREPGQYLGHPTTVLLEDHRTMLAVYPKGHGRGAIVMKRSDDAGLTWSERLPTPKSWSTSLEVPTVHRVVDANGKKRLILFSGLYPVRMAVTEDDGKTWSELEPVGEWGGVVTMASVVELRDGPGRYMAMFHDDGRFFTKDGARADPVVFTLYTTFSADGGRSWSFPEPIWSESDVHLCEPGVVRSPDGRELAALCRENSRRRNSHVLFSRDEGKTWSRPRELPGALTGDRHTGRYVPDGRLFISFRDTALESPTQGDWVAWVGTYDDIVRGREGQLRVRLMDNLHAWDCAYPAVEVLPGGTIVTTTYGHWKKGEKPYIVSVRLRLEELDAR